VIEGKCPATSVSNAASFSLRRMTEHQRERRIRERLELKLPVRVYCRETPDFEWVEITRLTNVTPFGAGFHLKRPTEKGRLLHMTIPMPRQLRVFDHVEDQYRVWALVRYVKALEQPGAKQPIFDVGVAFIGKRPPVSYETDPAKRYDITATVPTNTALTSEMVNPLTPSDQRAHSRLSIPIDVYVEVLDEKNEVISSEQTVTENISAGGATVFTSLQVPIGRFVRVRSDQYQITIFAVVRHRSTSAEGLPRIHLEFIDKKWPLV
jgi:hypothetical protein